MINNYFFDLDGTLVNSWQIMLEGVYIGSREAKLPPVEEEKVKSLARKGLPFSLAYREAYPDHSDEYPQVADAYKKFYKDNIGKRITLFPEVSRTFAELKERHAKVGIITLNFRELAEAVVGHFDLPYDTMLTTDDKSAVKPDPWPLLYGLERVKGMPNKTIYTGDDPLDVLQGRNAGVRTGIVLNTYRREHFILSPPDHYFSKLSEVLAVR